MDKWLKPATTNTLYMCTFEIKSGCLKWTNTSAICVSEYVALAFIYYAQ